MTKPPLSNQPEESVKEQLSRRALLKSGAIGGSAGFLAMAGASLSAAPIIDAAPRQALLTALVDTIIPTTDTPGAAEAGVADFVTMMVERWLHPDERARFHAGLDSFEATVRATSGQAFQDLSASRRLQILQAMAASEASRGNAQTNGPFIAQVRALTIYGYYTSEIGASQELDLNLVPGRYEHCHDLQPGEHAVSLGRSNPVLRMP